MAMAEEKETVPRESLLRERISERIRHDIMSGRLRFGDKISEIGYSEACGVGRGPVRDAFLSLSSLGLLEIRPRFGTYVATFTRKTIKDLFDTKLMLEFSGVKFSTNHQKQVLLKSLSEQFPVMSQQVSSSEDFDNFSVLDTEFHAALVAACENTYLNNMYRPVRVCAQAARSRLTKTPEIAEIANRHHDEVVKAIAKDDMAGLEIALGKHLSWVLGMLLMIDELF